MAEIVSTGKSEEESWETQTFFEGRKGEVQYSENGKGVGTEAGFGGSSSRVTFDTTSVSMARKRSRVQKWRSRAWSFRIK